MTYVITLSKIDAMIWCSQPLPKLACIQLTQLRAEIWQLANKSSYQCQSIVSWFEKKKDDQKLDCCDSFVFPYWKIEGIKSVYIKCLTVIYQIVPAFLIRIIVLAHRITFPKLHKFKREDNKILYILTRTQCLLINVEKC